MQLKTFKYCVFSNKEDVTKLCENFSEIEYECYDDFDNWEDVADFAACNYWQDCDGWEARWPLYFTLFDLENNYKGTFKIDVEFDPNFIIKEEK